TRFFRERRTSYSTREGAAVGGGLRASMQIAARRLYSAHRCRRGWLAKPRPQSRQRLLHWRRRTETNRASATTRRAIWYGFPISKNRARQEFYGTMRYSF